MPLIKGQNLALSAPVRVCCYLKLSFDQGQSYTNEHTALHAGKMAGVKAHSFAVLQQSGCYRGIHQGHFTPSRHLLDQGWAPSLC